ncbi:MAG: 50S ribosomal protein L6 [Planctomycetes bacterium]|nr:50S ribosomal protein L6 [Planctomycetota bacterium]NOG54817.1 50S ribosomal protein L6 [Planctomycetota bacterium]
MSRVGSKPVTVPAGVSVSITGRTVTVEKGGSRLQMEHRPEVTVQWNESDRTIACTIPEDKTGERQYRAYWGLTRSLIQNMVVGVTEGYMKRLEVVGSGWSPQLQGNKLVLNVGYCDPVIMPIPAGLDVQVERQIITIKGADKQAVGHFAASARAKRKPEPYKGKGVKYVDEQIIRKQGKAVVGR